MTYGHLYFFHELKKAVGKKSWSLLSLQTWLKILIATKHLVNTLHFIFICAVRLQKSDMREAAAAQGHVFDLSRATQAANKPLWSWLFTQYEDVKALLQRVTKVNNSVCDLTAKNIS